MRNRAFVLGATLVLSTAAFAQEPSADQKASTSTQTQSVVTTREAGSGMATGNRSVAAPRDAASGQATGKRQHKPMQSPTADDQSPATTSVHGDLHVDEAAKAREAGSGIATGKRQVQAEKPGFEYEVKSPRDAASGQATGKRQHGKMSNAQSNPLYQEKTRTSSPLYDDKGREVQNPLYTGQDKRVQSGVATPAGAAAGGAAIQKTKTRSNQSNDRMGNPGSLGSDSEEAAVIKTKTKSNQSNDRLVNAGPKDGWPNASGNGVSVAQGDVDGDGKAEEAAAAFSGRKATKSRSNIQNNRTAQTGDLDGDGAPDDAQKATINTTRSNIKHQRSYSDVTWESTGTGGSKPSTKKQDPPRPEPAQPRPTEPKPQRPNND